MDYNGKLCQGICAELFALCRNDSWSQIATPAGYAATWAKPEETLHFDFFYIGLSRDGKYQYMLLLKDDKSGY
jgi:hypothetical protein